MGNGRFFLYMRLGRQAPPFTVDCFLLAVDSFFYLMENGRFGLISATNCKTFPPCLKVKLRENHS